MPDKLTVGISFHTCTLPALPPLVSVYRFPTICSEAVCHIRLIRLSWVARRRRRLLSAQYWARLLRKVLGRYQYHPILASIGQYPIPQYRYRSNPRNEASLNTCSLVFLDMKIILHSVCANLTYMQLWLVNFAAQK